MKADPVGLADELAVGCEKEESKVLLSTKILLSKLLP